MTSSAATGSKRLGTRRVPKEVRREQMLDVAGEVFAERGYHAAAMDEIAERADISKPMLYAYFGSKEGLYDAYLARSGDRLLRAMADALDPALSTREQMRATTLAYLSHVEAQREGFRVLRRELPPGGGASFASVGRVRTAIIGGTARLLRDAGAPPAQADALAHAVVGASEALVEWWLDHPEVPREEVASRLIDLAWTGLERTLSP